jgi:hypothetical protein
MINSAALQSVPDRDGALEAAGAIYDTAAETPQLRFLIEVKSKWLERALTVGMFYAPLVGEIRRERAARHQPGARPSPRPSAAAPSELDAARAGQNSMEAARV